MKKNLFLSFLLVACFHYSKSDVCSSQMAGDWDNPATWSCGHKPTCGDTVYISHLVTLTSTEDYTGCGTPMQIVIEACGTLHFVGGRKLKLPCGSGVELEPAAGACPAGALTADGYSGASESLQICGSVVWQSANGPQAGPLTFGSVLPIELLSFNANLIDKTANIYWSTASETNNNYFTIERSKDGELWAEISRVNGAGTSSAQIDYLDIDDSPLNGVSYYRLKQTDFDGAYTYSNISVLKNGDAITADINPFPNPSDGNSFNLEFTGFSDEELLVVVRDIQGKTHYSKVYLVADHNSIVAVDLENKLPVGSYFITASSDEKLVSKKIIVR